MFFNKIVQNTVSKLGDELLHQVYSNDCNNWHWFTLSAATSGYVRAAAAGAPAAE